MSDNKINITESEWKIMQVIWNEPNLTLGDIKKRLDEIILWDRTTISTLLRRLKKKNVVGAIDGRYAKYYALVSENECLLQEINSILDKFFYQSPKKLMATLVKNEKFSDDDIKDIEELLESIKKGNE